MFLAFICANNIGSLVNNLFQVKIFILVPSFTSSSSSSCGCNGGKLVDSLLSVDSSLLVGSSLTVDSSFLGQSS